MRGIIKTCARALIPSRLRYRLKLGCKQVYFVGFRYKCPLCNSHLRTFLPFGYNFAVLRDLKVVGGGHRSNTLCPLCKSTDRERLLYLYLSQKTDIFKGPKKVLHIAPEAQVSQILRCAINTNYVTADLCAEDVMLKVDLTTIPFVEEYFDIIICNHVLEHIHDDRMAMAELFRILKPGGWAIVQVPISLTLDKAYEDFSIITPKGREEAFGQNDHVRIYAKDYKRRLAQAGFDVNVFKWTSEAHNFGGSQNLFGLNEDEEVYCARKPEHPSV
jgi:predicted SAM-dependent methyltransferase